MGNLATEIFFGPSLAGGLRVPTLANAGGHLLETLTSDLTPRVDSACYRRYHFQKFGRALKAACRVFLKEHLKEND